MKVKPMRIFTWLFEWHGWKLWRIFTGRYWYPWNMTEDFWGGK